MSAYRFTQSAREDLIDIWLYTEEASGEAQADSYQDTLHHCQHHYLFFVEQDSAIIIVAVLHERMNLIERLRDRL